jgi:tetratricopeptide (TPR) repeat protein
VFVSSTFRDMQAEREVLVKEVFPAVRARCARRGVLFAEVDLRWGVTDEQSADGAVLPICLAEIDRCRPYFIGLLGQRYGWIPDTVDADLVRRIGWLSGAHGRSVTEMEIIHGVLADPAADRNAYFYLRDPSYLDRVDEDRRAVLVDDDDTMRALLSDLRDRVRASDLPSADYADPAELGRLVLADLEALIDRLFPEDEPPDRWSRARAAQRGHAGIRAAAAFDRPEVAASTVAYLDRSVEGSAVPLVLAASPGSGVDGVVAGAVTRWAADHPEAQVIWHATTAEPDAADPAEMLRRMVAELRRDAGDHSDSDDLPTDQLVLRGLLAAELARSGRPTVLVVSFPELLADELGAPELTLLPERLPPATRIVVATSSDRTSRAAADRGWTVLPVPELDQRQRRDYVTAYLARYAKGLDVEPLDRICRARQTGNELFLSTMLDELRQHGDHFTLGAEIDRMLGADTVEDLLAQVLARYERDFETARPGLTAALMAAIGSSRRGLSEAELSALLSDDPAGRPLPRASWSPLFLAACGSGALVDRDGLLDLGSAEHRAAAVDRYLATPEARREGHRSLARFFATSTDQARRLDELPHQLAAADDLAALARVVADPTYLTAAYRRSYPDLRRYVAACEAAGHRIVDAYPGVFADPEGHPALAWELARIAADAGYPGQALPLHRYLAAHGDRPEMRRTAAVNLGAALWSQGDATEAEQVLAEVVEDSRAAGDRVRLAAALGDLALVRRDLGRLDDALVLFAEHEGMLRADGNLADLQASLGNRVQILRQRGDDERALALIDEQQRLCASIGDELGVARAAAARGTVLADLRRYPEALDAFRTHGRLARASGDLRGLLESLLNQADTSRNNGDPGDARAMLEEAVGLARRLSDLPLLARGLVMAGLLAADEGRWPDARAAAAEAITLARSATAPEVLARALGVGAMAARELRDLTASAAMAAEAEALCTALADPTGTAAARVERGNAAAAAGDLSGALAFYTAAEPALRSEIGAPVLLPMLANRWQVQLALGRTDEALADLESAAELAARLGNSGLRTSLVAQAAGLLTRLRRADLLAAFWERQVLAARAGGDSDRLQQALGEGAVAAIGLGRLDVAAGLLDEQQELCRASGNLAGLAACVGNRAILHQHRGDPTSALGCLDTQLSLCQQIGDGRGLLVATANRGEVLATLGRVAEAAESLQRARQLAAGAGHGPMVAQLDQMLAALPSN